MDYTEKTLSCEDIYRGRIIYVHKDVVRLPNGGEGIREIVEHSGGVTVLPLDENGDVYCVRQYRYAYGTHMLETPAGKLEPGEDPLTCAVRELGEETGFTADEFIYLGEIYPSPGYCKESLHLYLALGLHPGTMHLDSDEFLEVEKYSLDALLEMVTDGRLRDAKTVTAVLMAKRWLDRKENC